MIPPCDPAILEKNPQFKKLHQHLTGNLLNADGSTRADADNPERKALAEELKNLQIKNAKKKIIRQAVRRLASLEAKSLDSQSRTRNEGSSYNPRETSAVIAMFLDAPPTLNEFEDTEATSIQNGQQVSLLNGDIQNFHDNIHVFTPLLSEIISSWLNSLRSVADAGSSTTNNSSSSSSSQKSNLPTIANQSRSRIRSRLSLSARKVQIPRLSTQLEERIDRLRELQSSQLPAARRAMAVTAASLLATRGEAMERMIVLLERTKHGALSRGTKAHADYLATVAECMSNKVQVTKLEALSAIYTPESTVALENYRTHLYETQKSLEEKKAIATQTLEEYDEVGTKNNKGKAAPGPMADIARRYGDLAREVEVIQIEIKKLKSYNH